MTLQSALTKLYNEDQAIFIDVYRSIRADLLSEGKIILISTEKDNKAIKIVREKEVLYYTTPKKYNDIDFGILWEVYKL